LPIEGIAQVVRQLPRFNDPNLLVGAEGGSDAGVYRLRADLLIVQSLDFFPPLVDDPYVYGQIAAANSLSDVFVMGARPTTAMNIVAFPDDELELAVLSEILAGGAERVQQAGAVVIGGHSIRDKEIKYGLSVTGVVEPERLMTNRDARPGDVLVLTKALGTGYITTAFKAGCCPEEVLQGAIASMIQLNAGGRDAAHLAGAKAATDITGFGLAGHAIEMAEASGVTIALDVPALPILPGAEELARAGNRNRACRTNREFAAARMRIAGQPDEVRLEMIFDPQTSGGLLISVAAERGEVAVAAARAAGASAACIVGTVIERQAVSLLVRG
jgi:selenide, water dikinase